MAQCHIQRTHKHYIHYVALVEVVRICEAQPSVFFLGSNFGEPERAIWVVVRNIVRDVEFRPKSPSEYGYYRSDEISKQDMELLKRNIGYGQRVGFADRTLFRLLSYSSLLSSTTRLSCSARLSTSMRLVVFICILSSTSKGRLCSVCAERFRQLTEGVRSLNTCWVSLVFLHGIARPIKNVAILH